ncbi:MAG: cellobiose phosphorylase [Clostridiales bacterium]|nr:cellobiose phosphorylase [Clostridiales bacterium]
MAGYEFIDNNGTFRVKDPDLFSYLYFPTGGTNKMMGAVTPELGGDLKTGQNTFVLEPVSSDNLHNNRSGRNFWLRMENGEIFSATGMSAGQQSRKFTSDRDDVTLTAGLLWHNVTRRINGTGLETSVTTFVPAKTDIQVELTGVTITNKGDSAVSFTPVCAIPVYGRSADNIRDHRNVTSMLNRMTVTEHGVVNDPTLTFDERGHKRNTVLYGVFSSDENGNAPVSFCPVMEEFIGEGGTLDNPRFVYSGSPSYSRGARVDGFEAMGAAAFEEKTLEPGQKASYVIAIAIKETGRSSDTEEDIISAADGFDSAISAFLGSDTFESELDKNKTFWTEKNNIRFRSGDRDFDNWMYWVAVQPMLRRIYGCSFLPHHDYGKGGRGWRDLWQDCLALIIMDPSDVRQMLIENFGGVRTDGTNATIIGSGRGEFIADRNGITRVWMDHAMWPFMTMDLYIAQTGDLAVLDETVPYFADRQIKRGEALLDKDAAIRSSEGTVLEHLLLQNLAAFFDIGEHGHMKLRGADWNDALDMASKRGESVAFTAAYCGNYIKLAKILRKYSESMSRTTISLAKEIRSLLGTSSDLMAYCDGVSTGFSGEKDDYSIEEIASDLEAKAGCIRDHIRNTEYYTDDNGLSRYNGYYDDNGRPLEKGGQMMLTGEVFTIMSGIATDDQIREIVKSADRYLYDASLGGYRLNSNFHEIKTDMGRMFGFAYGQKENGAVFSHMSVMFGNALYSRGFAQEGWKVIGSLYRHATDFPSSKIYPGIPEYFDPKGRGVYHYLTGAASWLMLTALTEMYGVKGDYGDIRFEPSLLPEQFDNRNEAGVDFMFNGKPISLTYKKTGEGNNVISISVDGVLISQGTNKLPAGKTGSQILVMLG